VLDIPTGTKAGDEIEVALSLGMGAISGTTSGPSGAATKFAAFGAQHGWVLINPFTPSHELATGWLRWTMAWLAGWGMLVGWWAGAARWPLAWGTGALAGFLVIAALWHARASNPELLALALGWCVAAISSRRCRHSAAGP
jgi:hypothetical protein